MWKFALQMSLLAGLLACGETAELRDANSLVNKKNKDRPTEKEKPSPTKPLGHSSLAHKTFVSVCKSTTLEMATGWAPTVDYYKSIDFHGSNDVTPPRLTDMMVMATYEILIEDGSEIVVITHEDLFEGPPMVEKYKISKDYKTLTDVERPECPYKLQVEEI